MVKKIDFRRLKKYISLSALIFLLSVVSGIFFVLIYPSVAEETLGELEKAFAFLFEMESLQMFLFLLFNNSLKIFLFIFLGVVFAIPTLFFLFINGWVLGYVATLAYFEIGIKGLFFNLFFHGIFEVTALIIGSSLGIYLGVASYEEIKNKGKKISFNNFSLSPSIKGVFSDALNIFLKIIFPLLVIAAIIETFLIFY